MKNICASPLFHDIGWWMYFIRLYFLFLSSNDYVQVVKKPGVIIRPIEFKEVNPHENTEGHKSSGQKQKMKKSKGNGTKMTKKTKMAGGKTMKVK